MGKQTNFRFFRHGQREAVTAELVWFRQGEARGKENRWGALWWLCRVLPSVFGGGVTVLDLGHKSGARHVPSQQLIVLRQSTYLLLSLRLCELYSTATGLADALDSVASLRVHVTRPLAIRGVIRPPDIILPSPSPRCSVAKYVDE
jgi:hypothetical protein